MARLAAVEGTITNDNKFLALRAFGLQPVLAASAPVGQVAALGDDAFKAEAARMCEHRRAVGCKMLAEPDRRIGRQPSRDGLQQILAIQQRRLGEVAALAIHEVEGEIAEPIAPAGFQIGLQIVEAGNPGGVLDHDFAVDQRRAEPELRQSIRDGAKARRPVESLAGQEPDAAPVDSGLNPVAVMLDLVDPVPGRPAAVRRAPRGSAR